LSTSSKRRFPGTVSRIIAGVLCVLLVPIAIWAINVSIGMRAASQTSGTLRVAGLSEAVSILRDARDIPHIRAQNDRDLFFAQGFVEASDRLFQMDLLRRYVYGELAEVIGPIALHADETARIADMRGVVHAQWARMSPQDRALVQAFSDGVNASMRSQPLPVEFRLLLYKPKPWDAQDSLAVGMATALDLIDPWDDVIRRDTVSRQTGAPAVDLYSITDPAYDAPVTSRTIAAVRPLSALNRRAAFMLPEREAIGSNEWAAGAAHSALGRSMLANDPHLRIQIPGVWYVVDLADPGMHVAGGSLAGTPGVILGHNDRIAWGATNGTVVTEVVYCDAIAGAAVRNETFHVRFAPDVHFPYYRTRHGFVAEIDKQTAYAVDWNAYRIPNTALTTFEGLDRARSMNDALRALRSYPGPPQNFVIAAQDGTAAYHLAGLVPEDPSWGLRVHGPADPLYRFIPFDSLPHVDPSKNALVFTANNRMYGAGYPFRLTARRIEQMLASRPRLGVDDFSGFQADTLSLPELELAKQLIAAAQRTGVRNRADLRPYLDAVAAWNGRFDRTATGAPIVRETALTAAGMLAAYATGAASKTYDAAARPTIAANTQMVLLMRVLRERPRGWWPNDDYDGLLLRALNDAIKRDGARLLETWGAYDPIAIRHPFAPLGFSFLNGRTLPGDGDSYSVHVQNARDTQSFRAVWVPGDWDRGGIVIPSGESGEPGSGHYTDQTPLWLTKRLAPLPFSDAAVRAAAVQTLRLLPAQGGDRVAAHPFAPCRKVPAVAVLQNRARGDARACAVELQREVWARGERNFIHE
jgi:penicillin amidase